MKNRTYLILIPLFFIFPLWAQTDLSPHEPEIILPSLFLEIQEEDITLLEAPLPGETDSGFAAVDVPLPDPEAAGFSPLAIAIPGYDGLDSPLSSGAGGNDFFSEATIGVGTANHILGDIVLYKLGKNPRFQLHFLHQGWDGFAGHDPGEGYSRRREFLGGELEFSGERYFSGTELYYRENDWGLQGNNPVSGSLTNRTFSGFTEYRFDFSSKWAFLAEGSARYSSSVLNGSGTSGFSEVFVQPKAGIGFYPSLLDWELRVGYRFRNLREGGSEQGTSQGIFADTVIYWPLPWGLDLEARAEVIWEPDRYTRFPFSLTLRRDAGRVFNFLLSGGYRLEISSLEALWEDYPFLKPSGTFDLLPDQMGWFARAEGRLNAGSSLTFTLGGEYRRWENSLEAQGPDADGLYRAELAEIDNLRLEAQAEWRPRESLVFRASWSGQPFLEAELLKPAHSFGLQAEWNGKEERYGFSAGAVLNRYSDKQAFLDETWLPRLDFSGYYRIGRGVRLYLEGHDILAPFLPEKRKLWDSYQDISGAVSVKLGISL